MAYVYEGEVSRKREFVEIGPEVIIPKEEDPLLEIQHYEKLANARLMYSVENWRKNLSRISEVAKRALEIYPVNIDSKSYLEKLEYELDESGHILEGIDKIENELNKISTDSSKSYEELLKMRHLLHSKEVDFKLSIKNFQSSFRSFCSNLSCSIIDLRHGISNFGKFLKILEDSYLNNITDYNSIELLVESFEKIQKNLRDIEKIPYYEELKESLILCKGSSRVIEAYSLPIWKGQGIEREMRDKKNQAEKVVNEKIPSILSNSKTFLSAVSDLYQKRIA